MTDFNRRDINTEAEELSREKVYIDVDTSEELSEILRKVEGLEKKWKWIFRVAGVTAWGELNDEDIVRFHELIKFWVFNNASQVRINPMELSDEAWKQLKTLALENDIPLYFAKENWERISETEVDLIKQWGEGNREDYDYDLD